MELRWLERRRLVGNYVDQQYLHETVLQYRETRQYSLKTGDNITHSTYLEESDWQDVPIIQEKKK